LIDGKKIIFFLYFCSIFTYLLFIQIKKESLIWILTGMLGFAYSSLYASLFVLPTTHLGVKINGFFNGILTSFTRFFFLIIKKNLKKVK
jgi:hypothetical protein